MIVLPTLTEAERDQVLAFVRGRFEAGGVDRGQAADWAVNLVQQFPVTVHDPKRGDRG